MKLTDSIKRKRYIVEAIPDIEFLTSIGIDKGIEFIMETRQPLGGPVVIKIGSRNVAIGKDIAREIEIREVV